MWGTLEDPTFNLLTILWMWGTQEDPTYLWTILWMWGTLEDLTYLLTILWMWGTLEDPTFIYYILMNVGYSRGPHFYLLYILWMWGTLEDPTFIYYILYECVVPENIHTPTTEGIFFLTPHPPGISNFGPYNDPPTPQEFSYFGPPTPQEFPEQKIHEKNVRTRDSDFNVSPITLLQLMNY